MAILLLVTGCPGTTSRGGGGAADEIDNQNSADVTNTNDNNAEPTPPEEPADPTDPTDPTEPEDPTDPTDPTDPPPDENPEVPEVPEDLPPGSEFFLALLSGPPPDWAVEASLGSDSVSILSFVETGGVYTIELSILTSEAGAVEAKGTAIGTAGITQLADSLPVVAGATNLTIDVSDLVAILDPLSPRFSLVVVFNVATE
jgi:hypothetical protein